MNIQDYLKTQKERVDQALRRYLDLCVDAPPRLHKAMQYSLEAGGKRLRPVLALAAAQAVGGALEPVLPVACALEYIHTFSLIHDDLPAMDNDDFRRGQPTNHKVFGENYAILAGDGLLSEAFWLMCHPEVSKVVEPALLLEVIRDIAYATGAQGMVGGQVLDLEGEGQSLAQKELEKIHRYKTGWLITISVLAGAKLSGATPAQIDALRTYGEKIGLAFQIADDVLNVEGTLEQLGKSAGSDAAHNKSTYPALLGLGASKELADRLIREAQAVLADLGAAAEPLRQIAEYVVRRKN